ncbi:unnamed protein product [Peronospora destructor]|uniref:Uncharacterized protein n=1 Tax=Peronospora destructor TaxID=86335 RepID=A0AAV0VD56_9STRA|nr:unnamed protein product [Peronospora destructor]
MATISIKDLDAKLRALREKTLEEEASWLEQGSKLFDYEDKLLRDTLLEGNILMGWGEPRTAPVRFRNARVRKRKRERLEMTAEHSKDLTRPLIPTLSAEEQLKVDRHRLASYSSVQSPAEPLYATLKERGRKVVEAKNKKLKRPAAK